MINENYQSILNEIEAKLSGAKRLQVLCEDDFFAKFLLDDILILTLECEIHFGPSFTLSIGKKDWLDGKYFAVWLLMRSFCKLTGKNYGAPSLSGQIYFLCTEFDRLVTMRTFYEKTYDELNDVAL